MILQQFRKFLPLFFAIVFVLIASNSVSYKSHTRDENRHLIRGVMLLETGDYRLNKHHPLLANVIAAIPQIFNDKLQTPSTDSDEWDRAAKDEIADEFVEVNGGKKDFVTNVLNKSRYFMIITFALLGLWICSLIAQELNSTIATIFTFLYFFSPNIIAHSQLVTTDALIIPFVFATTFFLYKYSKDYHLLNLLIFILLGFLSLMTKYSVVPIALVWLVILGVIVLKNEKEKKLLRILRQIALTIGIWTLLLTACYGFRFETLKSTNYADTQKTENNLNDIQNLFKRDWIVKPLQNIYQNVRLPFPEYIGGFLDNVFFHNAYGHDAFLFGHYSKTGWWYFFPAAFFIKEPTPIILGTLILIGLGFYFAVTKRIKNKQIVILIIVPTLYSVLTMFSSLNLGLRYILIIYPFIFLGIAALIYKYFKRLICRILTISLASWYLLSCALIYPEYLSYFNEFVGGPKNGYLYLLNSNLSWAQNDFLVEDYVKSLKTEKDIYVDPLDEIKKGVVIYDVDLLMGRDVNKREKTAWIREPFLSGKIQPIDRIAYTHLVFEF